jgi:hypothetical protein
MVSSNRKFANGDGRKHIAKAVSALCRATHEAARRLGELRLTGLAAYRSIGRNAQAHERIAPQRWTGPCSSGANGRFAVRMPGQ